MSDILSREEFEFWKGGQGAPVLVEQADAQATIEALADAFQAAWVHADSHEKGLAESWKPVITDLREKGWIK